MPEKEFEPPKYIASLIAAINDGAKAAQTGALAFLALGIYLLAVAVSTTDEDLLLDHTTNLAQLGVQVSPEVSLGIAPVVFVALHIFTLVRYDLLGANLRRLSTELATTLPLEVDRERCRQLLSNVEFVIARAVPPGSPLHSRLFSWLASGIIIVFPIVVLSAAQVSTLRYQHSAIIWAQAGALLIDLFMVTWFSCRVRLAAGTRHRTRWRQLGIWAGLLWLPSLIVTADVAWVLISPRDAEAPCDSPPVHVDERYNFGNVGPDRFSCSSQWPGWHHPLDEWLCPCAEFGCRHLAVAHRTLVAQVWKPDAIAEMRSGSGDHHIALAELDGVFLRGRLLRQAKLQGSALYKADLVYAHLDGADLTGADLTGANLFDAWLSGALLSDAHLRAANLINADLPSARLDRADLTDANLTAAHLKCADLGHARLRGANLAGADLRFALMGDTDLIGANLHLAQLNGAILVNANVTGGNLKNADLNRIDLSNAYLNGADLTSAHLTHAFVLGADFTGADLRGAQLNGTTFLGAKYDASTKFPDDFNPQAP